MKGLIFWTGWLAAALCSFDLWRELRLRQYLKGYEDGLTDGFRLSQGQPLLNTKSKRQAGLS